MKNILKIRGLLLSILSIIAFYGCSQEEEVLQVNNNLQPIDKPCSITIDLNDNNGSRLAFNLNGNSLKSTWSKGDQFEIYKNNICYTFTLDDACDGSSVGIFTSPITPPSNNLSYSVYFPSKNEWNNLSFKDQVQDGDDNTAHLADRITMWHTVVHYTDIRFISEDYVTYVNTRPYQTRGDYFMKNTIYKINASNLPVDFQPVYLELEYMNPLSPGLHSPFLAYNTQKNEDGDIKISMTLKNFDKDKSFVAYMAQAVHPKYLPAGSVLRLTIKDANGETYYADKIFNSDKTISGGALAIFNYTSGWTKGNNSDYESSDKSLDGTYVCMHTATVDNGINIVFMGDGFSDRQIADGTYEDVMKKGFEAFFSEEPFKSFKHYFNVYYVVAVSDQEGCNDAAVAGNPNNTVFKTYFGDGTFVAGDIEAVKTYTRKIEELGNIPDKHLTSIVMMNSTKYAGTCHMLYSSSHTNGEGYSVSYFPIGASYESLRQILTHEANGHGFGKLADEYNSGKNSSCTAYNLKNVFNPMGWHLNIDTEKEPANTIWGEFYTNYYKNREGIGAYAGAYTWPENNNPVFYRPTNNSIMRYNTGGFNVPSRKAIYVRMHKIVYGQDWSWEDHKKDFANWDTQNVYSTYNMGAASRSASDENFIPLASPIIIPLDE